MHHLFIEARFSITSVAGFSVDRIRLSKARAGILRLTRTFIARRSYGVRRP